MIECPICLKQVTSLKSGSHVLPRWAMKMTKEGRGNYASLDLKEIDEPKAKKAQTDLICDFWCQACEDRFRDDDANGARFFRDKVNLVREEIPGPKNGNSGFEEHDPIFLGDLKSFIVSLFLRSDLYALKAFGKSFLGPRFSYYAKAHSGGSVGSENIGMVIIRNTLLGASHSSPVKTRFETRNCIRMVFCGCDIFLISDQRGMTVSDFSKLITANGVFVPVTSDASLPLVKNLRDVFKKTGPVATRVTKNKVVGILSS